MVYYQNTAKNQFVNKHSRQPMLQDQLFSELSRPRLAETLKFQGCRYRDSLRPFKLWVVETETLRDHEI